MATTTAPEPFLFPPEYSFPPFFTHQPNQTTHHAQLTKWSALVLAYARHHRIHKLSLSSAADTDLFRNQAINRRLAPKDIRDVMVFMQRDGRAEFVSGGTNGDVVYVFWRTPEEWATVVEGWVENTGQKGGVLTVYELTDGEGTRGTGTVKLFYGLAPSRAYASYS